MKLRTILNIACWYGVGCISRYLKDQYIIINVQYNKLQQSSVDKQCTQINAALRLISATRKGTALQWLYILCNIAPVGLLRIKQCKNIIEKSILYENSVLYNVLEDPVIQRLKNRTAQDTFFNNIKNCKLDVECSMGK